MEKRLNDLSNTIASQPVMPMVLMAAITVLALVMRLFMLGKWSFWIDEIYTLERATALLKNAPDVAPISTMLIAGVLKFVPVGEWSTRIMPALIGVLTLPLLYFPVKKLFGPGVALLTILFLALSPWHLHWSQNARFYTALMLFYTLALLIFYLGMEEDKPAYLLFSFVLLGLATLERKMALFFVPVVVAYLLIVAWKSGFRRPLGLSIRNLTAMAIPVILVSLYEVYVVIFAGQEAFYAKFLEIFIGHRHNPARVLLSVIVDLGLPMFLLALFGGIHLLRQKSRAGLFLVLGVMIPLGTIVAISPFTQTFSRYVFHSLPFWAILAAVAVKELYVFSQKHGRLLAIGVLLLVVADAASQDYLYYSFQNGNRQDWKGAFQIVQENYRPGDRVVTTRTQIGSYYMQEDVTWTQGLSPKEVRGSGLRTWFVIDDRTGFVSPELTEFMRSETHLVGLRDVYLPGKPMNMRVYVYDPGEGPMTRSQIP